MNKPIGNRNATQIVRPKQHTKGQQENNEK